MTGTLIFDPLIPWSAIFTVGAVSLAGVILAFARWLSGWALRGLAALVLIAALANPVFQQEDRALLPDIVILLEDDSTSQNLSNRAEQTATAADVIATAVAARDNTELRRITVADVQGDGGTRLMTALSNVLAEEPRTRVAGIIVLSDGRLHDLEVAPDLPAPLHLLLSGQDTDWDRRLVVRNPPAFAIIDEPVILTLRIGDQGDAPAGQTTAPLEIAINRGEPEIFDVPIGEDIKLPVTLPHGGRNVIQFTVPAADNELTDRNNTALIQINGVRDRLRVLLVSGKPHPGGRTWRNLLKSDSSVDLVHFTILRPPGKQDGVPVHELSLIAFPTRELFLEKIDDFDLIIFDRYKRRGILPEIYLDNIVRYVEAGGAVLVAAGPDFATADSIYRSPLSTILPAQPSARVVEARYMPEVTDLGTRHPVTSDLPGEGAWGHWLRQIDVTPLSGDVVMSGQEGRPLLVLDRVGKGRVVLLASDHAWLWSRGYDGGGPQRELLRRLVHWMMKEPELEEEALWAEATGQSMRVIRRSLATELGPLTITQPDGSMVELKLEETAPGRFEAEHNGPEIGMYRLAEGDLNAVVGLGPTAPREFEETIATGDILAPLIASVHGGILRLQDGLPVLRTVREGRPAAGRGWIGLVSRDVPEIRGVTRIPLLPPWLVLLLASVLIIGGWLREGR
ncbi:MAG: hypothetical protein GDA36_08435 [Rhodobacteraceae bacterium]|nr:hypothetical protein [Paracoccaceae bacterium]